MSGIFKIRAIRKNRIPIENNELIYNAMLSYIPIQFRPRTIAVNDGGIVKKSTHEWISKHQNWSLSCAATNYNMWKYILNLHKKKSYSKKKIEKKKYIKD